MTNTETKDYLTCAETARLVRAALKRAFPTVTFSVRSDTYSMGASVRIRWTDGPRTSHVQHVVEPFEGSRFDGMIDLKFHVEHWLLPDGTVHLARSPGSEGSRGVYPRLENPDPPAEGARRVSLGADFVFCSRKITNEEARSGECAAMIRSRCKTEGAEPHDRFGGHYVTDLAGAMIRAMDGETLRMFDIPEARPILALALEAAFREVVLGERPEGSA